MNIFFTESANEKINEALSPYGSDEVTFKFDGNVYDLAEKNQPSSITVNLGEIVGGYHEASGHDCHDVEDAQIVMEYLDILRLFPDTPGDTVEEKFRAYWA